MFLVYRPVHNWQNTVVCSEFCPTYKINLSQKYLAAFSSYLLLKNAQSKMFDRILNTPLEYAHIIYARIRLWKWYGLKAFTQNLNEFQSFGKIALFLNYIKRFGLYFHYFQKFFRSDFFTIFFYFHRAKRQKSFISYQ